MNSRLLVAGLCFGLLIVVQQTLAAEPVATTQPTTKTTPSKAHVLDKGVSKPAVVTAAAAKPTAYRNKNDLPGQYRAQKPLTPYTQQQHDYYASYPQDDNSAPYPNANPGYQSRPDYQNPYSASGSHLAYSAIAEEPVGGYGPYSHHAAYNNNPVQYSAIAPYQQQQQEEPYGAAAPYQRSSAYYHHHHYDPYSTGSAKPAPAKAPYWHSYQSAPSYSTGPQYGSDLPAYSSKSQGSYGITNQQPLRGMYHSSNQQHGSMLYNNNNINHYNSPVSSQGSKAAHHHPTVAHQDDPYLLQQQQQQVNSVLGGALQDGASNSNSLSVLGGGYAALLNKQQQQQVAAYAGGLAYNKVNKQATAGDPVSDQWWRDHQQLQQTQQQQGQLAVGDKLDALLTIINKLSP